VRRALWASALVMIGGGCNCNNQALTNTSGPDGGGLQDSGVPRNDSGQPPNCQTSSLDLTGCDCATIGASRTCYPSSAAPSTAGVPPCQTGTQTCESQGELFVFGPCVGAVTPQPANCTGGVNPDCSGKMGCADPACASNPACDTGCTDGQTRPCYTGPAGTDDVGACHDGTQVCVDGGWPSACPGEVLPATENCCAFEDLNCNGLYGCLDFYAGCEFAPCCQIGACATDAGPGCSCPQGAGDNQTCPVGTHIVLVGSNFDQACCPCTAADCSDNNCCGNSFCSTASNCAPLNCGPLPGTCNGQVSTDCDDWPEDCDEPCCECSQCDGGVCEPSGNPCNVDSDCCSQTCDQGTCN
jgi:hypothetical protein